MFARECVKAASAAFPRGNLANPRRSSSLERRAPTKKWKDSLPGPSLDCGPSVPHFCGPPCSIPPGASSGNNSFGGVPTTRPIDRWTDRPLDRPINRPTDRPDRTPVRPIGRPIGRPILRWADRSLDRLLDRPADRQAFGAYAGLSGDLAPGLPCADDARALRGVAGEPPGRPLDAGGEIAREMMEEDRGRDVAMGYVWQGASRRRDRAASARELKLSAISGPPWRKTTERCPR